VQNKLFTSCSAWMAVTGLILGTSTGFAVATPPTIDVQTAAQVATLNGTGATYGNANATFQNPAPGSPTGPGMVGSGTSAELFGGPSAADADTVLLVLSGAAASLDAKTITLTFDGLTPVSFTASNFFSTAAGSSPSNNNGAVNGTKFPTADHAAADITFSGYLTKNADLGAVTITSPINLRVDVFGDSPIGPTSRIVGIAPTSGGLGVIPQADPIALFAVATIGLMGVMVVRHRRHHCTSG
jgi:hypothetical protein